MKETIKRALRTFVQAAVGYLAANIVAYVTGASVGTAALKSALITLAGAAVACGLAAVMNLPAKESDAALSEVTDGAEKDVGEEVGDGSDGEEDGEEEAGEETGEEAGELSKEEEDNG